MLSKEIKNNTEFYIVLDNLKDLYIIINILKSNSNNYEDNFKILINNIKYIIDKHPKGNILIYFNYEFEEYKLRHSYYPNLYDYRKHNNFNFLGHSSELILMEKINKLF